jgi:hypothetical protein
LANLSLRVDQNVVPVALEAIGVVACHKGIHSLEIKKTARKQAVNDLASESLGRLVEELDLAIHRLHHDHVLAHYATVGTVDHVV